MHPTELPELSADELAALAHLYHTTRNVRLRTRVQIILLATEQRFVAREIAVIVRTAEETVRRWLKRYQAEGSASLADAPRPGAPAKITSAYRR